VAPHGCESDHPLAGKHVIVTRPTEFGVLGSPGLLEQRLGDWGARVSAIPLVTIEAVPFQVPRGAFDWLFFTSKNAVRAFFDRIPGDSPLRTLPIAVVGPATARALTTYGSEASFVAPRFDAEGAAEAFLKVYTCQGLRILWPCGNLANQDLVEILAGAGAQVMPLAVYQTILCQALSESERLLLQAPADLLVFTSPSAVSAYHQLMPAQDTMPAIACLGPKTRQTAMALLGRVDVQAEPSTLEALADAIQTYYCQKEDVYDFEPGD
jgi:uroporphyrinogen-III synthase